MFYKTKVQDIVNIKPSMFKMDLQEAAWRQLLEKYVGVPVDKLGYVIMVSKPKVDPLGKVVSEDGSSNHKAEFYVYSFLPRRGEIVEGVVVEIQDFGIFVRIGNVDAFVHKSWIMGDDRVVINKFEKVVIGEKTRKTLRVGDVVRGRVADVAIPRKNMLMKIALNLKDRYLGKLEWIYEELGEKPKGGVDEAGEKEVQGV